MRLTLSLWLAVMAAAAAASGGPVVRYLGQAKYLNGMKAVATHSIDDTTPTVATALEVIDRCGIKATIFVNTAREPIDKLWPRLRQAIADGHEIGAHGRTHPCAWPPNDEFCREYYTNDQVVGSRDDILKNTPQPYVWSWAYPCGHCVELPGIQQIIQRAGYLVARNYPDALKDEHLVANLQTWALNRYDAGYTQVAQKQAGHAKSGLTDVARLNAKFDAVCVPHLVGKESRARDRKGAVWCQ